MTNMNKHYVCMSKEYIVKRDIYRRGTNFNNLVEALNVIVKKSTMVVMYGAKENVFSKYALKGIKL